MKSFTALTLGLVAAPMLASGARINEQVTVTQTVTAPPAAGTPPPPAAAATHTVIVGGDDLVYIPDQLNDVPVGDMVIFQFMQQNHTVTQSSFATPCDPLDGGLDTGFQPNADNAVSPPPQVAMQVTTTEPLWFYCKQMGHCGKGMVFSINPTAEKSQAKFKELAIQQEGDAAQSTPTPTPAPPPANNGTTLVGGGTGATPGQGLIGSDGSCHCVVSCSAGGFPASSVQGLGSIGGMAGSLPMGDARV
ncbi:hypothetical protein GMORB2_4765 [Geosmithia morbida]|uniref:Cupredoxin n=1 Tax=Geosmithia morbida TaxID=1094350 RepID=A0A9P4YLZ0_9HYPO|nr:uncharacterized protein GMORB2_4765 [Geosmithia morbida]KAF4119423.1 hypothetical protein GMORB2_4765 [Geosmithia morbida]